MIVLRVGHIGVAIPHRYRRVGTHGNAASAGRQTGQLPFDIILARFAAFTQSVLVAGEVLRVMNVLRNPAMVLVISAAFAAFGAAPIAHAACSSEYLAVASALGSMVPGNQIAQQLYEIRLSETRSALNRCLAAERAAKIEKRTRLEDEAASAVLQDQRLQDLRQERAAQERAAQERAAERERAASTEASWMSEVSSAILEGRCKDAKEIALRQSRLDVADQAMRLCTPKPSQVIGKPSPVAPRSAKPKPRTALSPGSPAALSLSTLPSSSQSAESLSQVERGLEASRRGDYATADHLWRPIAEQGNPAAQYHLGLMYAKGQGVVQNASVAFSWFQRAAEQGYAAAQYNLGQMYQIALGVPQDTSAAVRWYRKAADQEYVGARDHLEALCRSRPASEGCR